MKLPMSYPPITSYNNQAALLGAISHTNDGMKYYYNHFIQLYVNIIGHKKKLCFRDDLSSFYKADSNRYYHFYNPFFEEYNIVENFLLFFPVEEIGEFIKRSIDDGFYINLYLDRKLFESNIHTEISAHEKHFYHDCIVYGYNEKFFYLVDFVGPGGKFDFSKISHSNFIKSYKKNEKNRKNHKIQEQFVDLFKTYNQAVVDIPLYIEKLFMFKIRNVKYDLDLKLILTALKDYYYSSNVLNAYEFINANEKELGGKIVQGMDVYDELFLKDDMGVYAMNNMFTLKDHKKAQFDRCTYLLENGYISDNWIVSRAELLYHESQLLLNLSIKYGITQDSAIKEKIRQKLQQMKDIEKSLLEVLIVELSDTV